MPTTYIQRDIASDLDTAAPSDWKLSTATGTAATVTVSVPTQDAMADRHAFITDAGVPGLTDWSGTHAGQYDVTSATNLTHQPFISAVTAAGSFVTLIIGTSSTGTGLFTVSNTDVYAGRATTDRYALRIRASNANMMAAESLTLRVNTADSYVTAPWTAGGGGTAYTQALTASTGFATASTRKPRKTLSGSAGFSGAIARIAALKRALTAAVSFAGSLTQTLVGGAQTYTQALTGSLGFSGALGRVAALKRGLTASVGFSGALGRVGTLLRGTEGTLTFSASLTQNLVAGAVAHTKALAASVDFSGTLSRIAALKQALTGTLDFAGTFARAASFKWVLGGGLTFSAVHTAERVAQALTQAFTASVGFGTTLARSTGTRLTAALTVAGSLSRGVSSRLTASLDFTTGLARAVRSNLSAALSFTGSLGHQLIGALAIQFEAALGFSGGLGRRAVLTVTEAAAQLTFSATTTARRILTQALAASLDFAGSVQRRTSRVLSGALSFTASAAQTFIAGAQQYAQAFTASVGFAGALTQNLIGGAVHYAQALVASVSFSTAFSRAAALRRALTASVGFTGSLSRYPRVAFGAVLGLSGALGRGIRASFTATLGFVVGFVEGLVGKIFHGRAPQLFVSRMRPTGKAHPARPDGAGSIPTPSGMAHSPSPDIGVDGEEGRPDIGEVG